MCVCQKTNMVAGAAADVSHKRQLLTDRLKLRPRRSWVYCANISTPFQLDEISFSPSQLKQQFLLSLISVSGMLCFCPCHLTVSIIEYCSFVQSNSNNFDTPDMGLGIWSQSNRWRMHCPRPSPGNKVNIGPQKVHSVDSINTITNKHTLEKGIR